MRRVYPSLDATLDVRLVRDSSSAATRGTTIFAAAPIPSGSTVARIPKSSVLSSRTSSLSQSRTDHDAAKSMLQRTEPNLLLAIHVLHEFLLGEGSKWCAYLRSLPLLEEIPLANLWPDEGDAMRWIAGTQLQRELSLNPINLVSCRSVF